MTAPRRGARTLTGRLIGTTRRLRVEIALRTPISQLLCRRWGGARGGLGGLTKRCDSPLWQRAALKRTSRSTWAWRLPLEARLLRTRYVVSARARDGRGFPVTAARTIALHVH